MWSPVTTLYFDICIASLGYAKSLLWQCNHSRINIKTNKKISDSFLFLKRLVSLMLLLAAMRIEGGDWEGVGTTHIKMAITWCTPYIYPKFIGAPPSQTLESVRMSGWLQSVLSPFSKLLFLLHVSSIPNLSLRQFRYIFASKIRQIIDLLRRLPTWAWIVRGGATAGCPYASRLQYSTFCRINSSIRWNVCPFRGFCVTFCITECLTRPLRGSLRYVTACWLYNSSIYYVYAYLHNLFLYDAVQVGVVIGI